MVVPKTSFRPGGVRTGVPAQPGGGPGSTIAQRLDDLPVTSLHVGILALCTIGLFADVAEIVLGNALAAVFLGPPHNLARGDLAILLAAIYAGGAIGAPVFGLVGDRFGRKAALQASLALMAVGALAAAASPGLTALTVARFVSGFAIGGYPPLAATYLADLLPPRRRGPLMVLSTAIGSLGAPAIIFLVRGLGAEPPLGIEAWRWALGSGALVGALTAMAMAWLPESPRWLAATGRHAPAARAYRRFEAAAGRAPAPEAAIPEPLPERGGFRALLAAPVPLRRTGLLVALYGLGSWAVIGFPLLGAAVLIQKGFRLDESLVFAGMIMFGPALGNGATALVVDRVGRRACLLACAAMMALAGAVISEGGTLPVLVAAGIAFNMAGVVYGSVLTLYASEILPTPLRGTALTCGWSASRVSAMLAPLVLLPLLTVYGPRTMFATIMLALALGAVVILRGPPGPSGRPVA